MLRLDKLGSTHTPAVSDRQSALREVEWRSSAEAEQCAGSASGDMTQHSTPWLSTGVLCRHPAPPSLKAHFPHNVILRGSNTVILITVILITLFGLSIFRRLQVSCFFICRKQYLLYFTWWQGFLFFTFLVVLNSVEDPPPSMFD